MENNNGIFIVLEGGEGAGKSTLIEYLEQAFIELGRNVTIFREPGGTEFAENVRDVFFKHENLSAQTSAHIMNAQRQDNIEKIILPALADNHVVIADRFTASTLVYQGILNDQYEEIKSIMIDLDAVTIFVDVRPEIGLQRIEENKRETNFFDEMALEKHQRVYQGFKDLAKLNPEIYWNITIDGENDLDHLKKIMVKIAKDIEPLIGQNISEVKAKLNITT